MFRIFTLAAGETAGFEHLTFPLYRPLLRSTDAGVLRVAADCGSAGAGLALANNENVLSVAVSKAFRNQGLGTSLLSHLERVMAAAGMQYAWLTYMSDSPSTPALERILQKNEWHSPVQRMVVCRSTIQKLVEGAWVRRHARYVGTPWKEVPTAALDALRAADDYPQELSPFTEDHAIEKTNSIALMTDDGIGGWMITHRIAPDTVRYTKLYVREAQRRLGFALVAEALARHADSPLALEAPNCSMDYKADNRAMSNFVHRHLGPTLVSVTVTKGSMKRLWENQRSVFED